MRLHAAREAYRRAELRLRMLLFGDGEFSGGRLRGDEARQQATLELRRMRTAFDEAVDEGSRNARRADLAEDLLDGVKSALERRPGRPAEPH